MGSQIKELLKALAWLIGGGIVRDLLEALRFFRSGGADVVFFYKNGIDEQWLGSTAEMALRELNAAVIIDPRQKLEAQIKGTRVYLLSSFSIFWLSAKLFVSTARIYWFNRPRKLKHQIYMPHSLASLHVIYDPRTFDGYDVLFCCGPHHVREVEMLNLSLRASPRLSYEIGYGKMDFLRSLKPLTKGRRPQIVVAPSWAPGNVIETVGLELIRGLLVLGYSVVLRPHPIQISSSQVRTIVDEFRNEPDFSLEIDSHNSILTADLMISDFSGVAFEFAFLRKRPVLFLDVSRKISEYALASKLPALEVDARNEIGKILPANDLQLIFRQISHMIAQEDSFQVNILAAREKYIYNFDDCARPALEKIRDLLSS